MGKYVIRRLLQMIPVIIGVTFIIYVAVYALGDPTVGRCGERACPPGYIAKFRADYNLDKPLIVQYLLYMGNLVQGDLGTNFYGNHCESSEYNYVFGACHQYNYHLQKHKHGNGKCISTNFRG